MKSPFPFAAIFPLCVSFFFTCLAFGSAPDRPPAWPDDRYVANGCYISTQVYLARLREAYPGVEARPGHVRFPSGQGHTVAVVEWRGKTFFRDIYLGVAEVTGDLQRSYDATANRWRARGGRHDYSERTTATLRARVQEVELAARLLAFLHPQILSVPSARGSLPVLSWTEPDGTLALYEPTTGTAFGRTTRHPLEIATSLFGTAQPAVHR
jgi:hypothetical protein